MALISGGSQGIGYGIAEGFAAAGASLVVTARSQERLDAACAELRAYGERTVIGVAADASTQAGIERIVGTALAELGRVDVLVNNIGASQTPDFRAAPIAELEAGDFDACFALNLRSPFLMSKAVAPNMIEQGRGAIINISSAAGRPYLLPLHGRALYGPAKAALVEMTRFMAVEWAPTIRVNCIAPGAVQTKLVDAPGDLRDRVIARKALKRRGVPADLVGAALLFASDAGAWITGATLDVNGGLGLTPV